LPQSNDFHKLQLIRSPNIGPVTYRQLLARFGNAKAALDGLPDLASRGGGRKFSVASAASIEKELNAAAQSGARYVFLGDNAYPELLEHLDNAPAAFTYLGDIELLRRPAIAMVGARNASAGACRFARGLAHDLANMDFAVVSGLARGIDTAAHRGSLDGGTIAVIAGGIDIAYPPENKDLQDQIAAKGLLIAEMPPGTEPRARHFPYRNRIIAGLALGTVVIEAAPKSGSLITARLAAEAGREVMAIPGSPIDPRARGCNQLIREGATLVQDASEIAEIIRPFDARMVRQEVSAMPYIAPAVETGDKERKIIIDLLGMSDVPVDELVRQSGMAPQVVQMVLLELELAGRLERGAGAKVKLTA
jgi:DNA processing protein